jgi:peptidoglycan/LPS O-acetylase OafA/YrhL
VATATTTEARAVAPSTADRQQAGRFGYQPALDGVRALAMLTILAYHFNYGWAKGGFLSVDTFFVMSGFLITTLLVLEYRRRDRIQLAQFWVRRARRLLPALFLVLAFVAVYTQWAVVAYERTRVRGDALASLFYVANWRFVFDNQDYFNLFSAASPLRHMWTLAIEEQYYLVWPLVVLGCLALGRGSTRVLTAACAVGVAASMTAMYVRYDATNTSSAYFATDARAQALLIGALLAIVLLRWTPSPRAQRVLTVVSLAAMLMLVAGFHTLSGTAPGYYSGLCAFFATMSALVVAGALHSRPLSSGLGIRPLAWTGKISYGLYLWHWPVIVWLVPSRVPLDGLQLNLLRTAVTFAIATASYYVVERPIRERSFRPRVALLTFAPAAAVVALVLVWSARGATPLPSYLAGAAPDPATFTAPGDSAPPQFIWGFGDPLICGEPRPDETAEATRAAQANAPLALPSSAAQQRVLLIGDSTACSLWPGLRAVGAAQHIATDQGSVFGCGIAIDEFTSTRNEAVTPNTQRCRPFLDWAIPRALARSNPNVVLWMSSWEKQDLVVDGRTIVAGTPEWEAEIMQRMDGALAELTANGARVVMVTEAAPAPNPAQGTETYDRAADDASYERLNGLLRRFQARHPDKVSIVDLASVLCPDGSPCPEDVDGLHARPDGRHFTPTSAVWAARLVLSQVFAPG